MMVIERFYFSTGGHIKAIFLKKTLDKSIDYIAPKDPAMYYLRFRVVRFRISGGCYETVYTNLDSETFPIGTIKELYRLRWGIETSFRELKYTIGLSCLHGKKTDFLLQEVFARLILYIMLRLLHGKYLSHRKNKSTFRLLYLYANNS